jgi:hypothetical protein
MKIQIFVCQIQSLDTCIIISITPWEEQKLNMQVYQANFNVTTFLVHPVIWYRDWKVGTIL